jgi:molybdopterin synthase sulfur carrier subunit
VITVRYFAAAYDAVGRDREALDVKDLSVAALKALLAERHPALVKVLSRSRLAIDQRFAGDADVIGDGVEVAVIPPVAGG